MRAALVNSGLLGELPAVVVRLDPGVMAGVTNELDLPIALAVLARTGVIVGVRWIFAGGRLGLDSRIYSDGLDGSPSIVTVVTALRSAEF
jgi:hypothetical protein